MVKKASSFLVVVLLLAVSLPCAISAAPVAGIERRLCRVALDRAASTSAIPADLSAIMDALKSSPGRKNLRPLIRELETGNRHQHGVWILSAQSSEDPATAERLLASYARQSASRFQNRIALLSSHLNMIPYGASGICIGSFLGGNVMSGCAAGAFAASTTLLLRLKKILWEKYGPRKSCDFKLLIENLFRNGGHQHFEIALDPDAIAELSQNHPDLAKWPLERTPILNIDLTSQIAPDNFRRVTEVISLSGGVREAAPAPPNETAAAPKTPVATPSSRGPKVKGDRRQKTADDKENFPEVWQNFIDSFPQARRRLTHFVESITSLDEFSRLDPADLSRRIERLKILFRMDFESDVPPDEDELLDAFRGASEAGSKVFKLNDLAYYRDEKIPLDLLKDGQEYDFVWTNDPTHRGQKVIFGPEVLDYLQKSAMGHLWIHSFLIGPVDAQLSNGVKQFVGWSGVKEYTHEVKRRNRGGYRLLLKEDPERPGVWHMDQVIRKK